MTKRFPQKIFPSLHPSKYNQLIPSKPPRPHDVNLLKSLITEEQKTQKRNVCFI